MFIDENGDEKSEIAYDDIGIIVKMLLSIYAVYDCVIKLWKLCVHYHQWSKATCLYRQD